MANEVDATPFRSADTGVEAVEPVDAVVKEARGAGDLAPADVEEREARADIVPESTALTADFTLLVAGGVALLTS